MNRALLNVLRILAVLLVLTGCSHGPKTSSLVSAKGALNELRDAVRDEIKEPARADEVAGVVDQMEQLMIEATEARKAHDIRLQALIRNYDAPEEDFKAAFREFNEKKISRQDRLLLLDQRARSLTTAREWKALIKVAVRALKESVQAEQGM
jgi:hypothetical protein